MDLKEVSPRIFNLTFSNNKDLVNTFVRFEEYFENPYFKNRFFSFEEFKSWYIKNSPKGKKTGKFDSYYEW